MRYESFYPNPSHLISPLLFPPNFSFPLSLLSFLYPLISSPLRIFPCLPFSPLISYRFISSLPSRSPFPTLPSLPFPSRCASIPLSPFNNVFPTFPPSLPLRTSLSSLSPSPCHHFLVYNTGWKGRGRTEGKDGGRMRIWREKST